MYPKMCVESKVCFFCLVKSKKNARITKKNLTSKIKTNRKNITKNQKIKTPG